MQLQNGRHDALHRILNLLPIQENMQSFRSVFYAPQQSTVILLLLKDFHPQSTGDGI